MENWNRVGPYVGVSRDFDRGRYRILIYGAFDAFGLIGPEKNGIAILDNEDRLVVADEMEKADSGYFGPTREQLDRADWLRLCTPEEFARYVNTSRRNRHEISADTVPEPAVSFSFELID